MATMREKWLALSHAAAGLAERADELAQDAGVVEREDASPQPPAQYANWSSIVDPIYVCHFRDDAEPFGTQLVSVRVAHEDERGRYVAEIHSKRKLIEDNDLEKLKRMARIELGFVHLYKRGWCDHEVGDPLECPVCNWSEQMDGDFYEHWVFADQNELILGLVGYDGKQQKFYSQIGEMRCAYHATRYAAQLAVQFLLSYTVAERVWVPPARDADLTLRWTYERDRYQLRQHDIVIANLIPDGRHFTAFLFGELQGTWKGMLGQIQQRLERCARDLLRSCGGSYTQIGLDEDGDDE